jgi:hypothetical protein
VNISSDFSAGIKLPYNNPCIDIHTRVRASETSRMVSMPQETNPLFTASHHCYFGLPRGKGKGKFHPITCHEVPEGEYSFSSTLSLTSALDEDGWSGPHPGQFTPRKETRSSVSLSKNIREGHGMSYRVRYSFPCPRYECIWKWRCRSTVP